MRFTSAIVLILLFAASPALIHADVTVTQIVTLKDAQADFTAARYTDCLKKIALALGASPAPSVADREALLSLKAECLLQQKQGPSAADAFSVLATTYTNNKDKKNAAVASATVQLIKKSQELQYTPKTGADKNPLPVVDPAKRPAALTALFNDQLSVEQDAVKNLLATKPSLLDILNYAPKLQDLDTLELGATGDDAQTVGMQKNLGTTAKTSMSTAIAKMNQAADTISANASRMVPVPGANSGGGGGKGKKPPAQQEQPKGLTDKDKSDLNDMIPTIDKIPTSTKNLVTALNLDTDFFKTEITNNATLRAKVEDILAGHFKAARNVGG